MRQLRRAALGPGIGWGAPYGRALKRTHLVTPKLDVNAGVGISSTGGKFGMGGATVEYVSASYNQVAVDAARLLAPGGVEFAYGVAFGLD